MWRKGLWAGMALFFCGAAFAQQSDVDGDRLRRLLETVEQQRLLLERQSRELKAQAEILESLQKQIDALRGKADEAGRRAAPAQSAADRAAAEGGRREVSSGQERVKLAVSGQVNRAVNLVDDGDNTKAYFVDNDASNSRVRFVGTARMTEDLALGSRIEFAFAPNESSTVTQGNEGGNENYVQGRWAEVFLDSRAYGKLSLGKGDTASNNTSQVDLSRTDVVMYSSIADIVAGLQFRTRDGKALTGIKVSDAFNDQDGLSRQSRLRYDTPAFHGFNLAGSLVSNQRSDAALFWGGRGLGFKAAGAAAVSDPNQNGADLRYNGSFSILHEATGLNLTVAAGMLRRDDRDDPANLYAKLGWIARFFDVGPTAFGVDATRSYNLPAENDEGYSLGAAVVQAIDPFGTEVYLQYRLFSLDRSSGPGVEDIGVGTVGARIKF